MIKIGLCGSSGSGKGYVCEIFKSHGIEHIDTDKVYTMVTTPDSACLSEICTFFGTEVLNHDGSLNKKSLSQKVFDGENAAQHLKLLNRITHKYIRHDVEKIISELEKKNCRAAIIDAPVLFESGFNELCDITVCVTAPLEIKLKRIIERDKITEKKAIARIESQLPDEKLRELCDYEIKNGTNGNISKQIHLILKEIGLEN